MESAEKRRDDEKKRQELRMESAGKRRDNEKK